jgi:hypothetical protein
MIRDRCQVIYENWMKKNSNLYLYYCFVRAICQKKEKKKKKEEAFGFEVYTSKFTLLIIYSLCLPSSTFSIFFFFYNLSPFQVRWRIFFPI